MRGALEQSIFRTVGWFSLFDTPVTSFEVWKWMLEPDRPYALWEVHQALDAAESDGALARSDGFWTLPGLPCRAMVVERRERFLDATRKYAKLRRAVRYLRVLPWLEGVAAANTLAWWNTKPESDIDLLIVTRPGTVWLSRLTAVLPFALLGRRPGTVDADPFCFSFFVSWDALGFSWLRLPEGDPYLAYWVRSLYPVWDRGTTFARLEEENAWSRDSLPHASRATGASSSGNARTPRSATLAVSLAESAAREFQTRRLPVRIKRVMNADSCVVVSDRMLKFHENDRREDYRERLRHMSADGTSAYGT